MKRLSLPLQLLFLASLACAAAFVSRPLRAEERNIPSIWDVLGVEQVHQATAKLYCLVGSTRAAHYTHQTIARPLLQVSGLEIGSAPDAFGNPNRTPPASSSAPGAAGQPSAGGSGNAAAAGSGSPASNTPANAAAASPAALPPSPTDVSRKLAEQTKPANVEVKVKAIRFLARQNCICYPEVVEALLQALDDCAEVVRFEALLALRDACGRGHCVACSNHGHGQLVTTGCHCCQCQEKVVVRLSTLLLDRDVSGRFRERSARVRRLAVLTIQECLQASGGGTAMPSRASSARPDPPLPGGQ